MKKILVNSSVASMIYKFNMNNIEILRSIGGEKNQIDVACNLGKDNPMTEENVDKFRYILKKKNIHIYETSCPRNIFSIFKIFKAYRQLKNLIDKENYDLIHTQSPIGGVVCRLAAYRARKKGTKVIYTAHGFHFFKGSAFINWITFYPIEKLCSAFSDLIITINHEDYKLAKEKFYAKKIEYVPGIGIDVNKFQQLTDNEKKIKKELLDLPQDAYIILSIGELNYNKNHAAVIKAIAKSKNKNKIYYLIAGIGKLTKELVNLAELLNVNLRLLYYRSDIADLLSISDLFIHASYREGLPVSIMEAMASKKVILASRIRGNSDLIHEQCLFEPNNTDELYKLISRAYQGDFESMKDFNYKNSHKYDIKSINAMMKKIYKEILY